MGTGLRISSRRDNEFHSRFEIGEETYEVGTEDLGIKKCKIVTRIYLKGEILFTVTSDYAHLAGTPDLHEHIRALTVKQHESAKKTFIAQRSKPETSKAHFAEEMNRHLKNRDGRAALDAARRALEQFPSDPFFLSHCVTSPPQSRTSHGWGRDSARRPSLS